MFQYFSTQSYDKRKVETYERHENGGRQSKPIKRGKATKGFYGKFKLRDLKFLVRWQGYEKESDTWQAWGTLRKNPKLKVFLEGHAKKAYNNLVAELPPLDLIEEEVDEIEY